MALPGMTSNRGVAVTGHKSGPDWRRAGRQGPLATPDSGRGYLVPLDSYHLLQAEQPSANKVLSRHGSPVLGGCIGLRLGNRLTSGPQFLHLRIEQDGKAQLSSLGAGMFER